MPRRDPGTHTTWMMSHLFIALGIAAAGAAMVSLIEHANDGQTPAATAWLISGSVALVLTGLIFICRSLVDYDRLNSVYRPVVVAMAAGAVVALALGWARPAPWLLTLLLVGVLLAIWAVGVDRWLRIREQVLAPDA